MKKYYLTITLAFLTNSLLASIIYVNKNATGSNNGSSWQNAYTDLQLGIAQSMFGDEIWVAAAVYKPTTGTSTLITFSVKNGTKLYGGFNGTETLLSQRNFDLNATILSGEIGAGTSNDNSKTILYFNGVANQTRVDGFTVTAAYNSNDYGGGAKSIDSSPTIANCKFNGNYSTSGGGAINHSGSGILTLDSCVFDGNVANTYGGGALRLYAGSVNITNCYFKSNQSNTYGGAIFFYSAVVNIDRCTFAGNICQSSGSAISFGDVGTVNLSNSLLVGNFANQSGVIDGPTFSNSSPHTIVNCTIAQNKDVNSGGSSYACAVALNNEASISNSIIYGNSSPIQVLSTGLNFSNSITQSASSSATGTNILYVNPQFILPGNVNSAPFELAGLNYQLNLLSPGIDVGANGIVVGNVDLIGNNRIHNNTVDLGAYESSFCNSTNGFTTTAPYSICGGNSISLTVDNGVQFLWSNGNTTNSINISSPGTYSVTFVDQNNCVGTLSANVLSYTTPTPSIIFSGGNLSCGNFQSYQWFFNGNAINGAVNNTHVPLEGYGSYAVTVSNVGGCIGNSSYCLSPVQLVASGPTTFCSGGSVNLNVTDGTSFVWSTGSLNSSISVNTSGNYSVNAFNNVAGCSLTLSQNVVANPLPIASITFDGNTFNSSNASTYQWNFNGTPISGANTQNYNPNPTGNGLYTVTLTNSFGCEATSTAFNLSNIGMEDLETQALELFPNPTDQHLTILGYAGIVRIYNQLGQCILTSSVNSTLDVSLLPSGMYFVKCNNEVLPFMKR